MRAVSWTLDTWSRIRRVLWFTWAHCTASPLNAIAFAWRQGLRRDAYQGWIGLCLVTAAGGIGGCQTVPAETYREAERQLQTSKEEIRRLEQQLADEQESFRQLREQLANARGMDQELVSQLVLPERIEIVSPSGGYSDDGQTGDDGIKLYVRPLDRENDTIKAAGSFKVTLLDLSEPASPNVVGQYAFDIPTTRSLWYGRLWTNHFTLACPWPPTGPPKTNEITVRVSFTALLTGTTMHAQGVFPVSHAPERTAASTR